MLKRQEKTCKKLMFRKKNKIIKKIEHHISLQRCENRDEYYNHIKGSPRYYKVYIKS